MLTHSVYQAQSQLVTKCSATYPQSVSGTLVLQAQVQVLLVLLLTHSQLAHLV
jgi:hypothetical protein